MLFLIIIMVFKDAIGNDAFPTFTDVVMLLTARNGHIVAVGRDHVLVKLFCRSAQGENEKNGKEGGKNNDQRVEMRRESSKLLGKKRISRKRQHPEQVSWVRSRYLK